MKFANISYGDSQRQILGPLLSLFYVTGMSQAAESTLYMYAVHPCLLFWHKKLLR